MTVFSEPLKLVLVITLVNMLTSISVDRVAVFMSMRKYVRVEEDYTMQDMSVDKRLAVQRYWQ